MNKVQIVPNASTGAIISAYQSNPDKGFIQLQQTAIQMDGSWIREVKRSTLLKASVDVLEKFVNANPSLTLKGQIVVKEYLESELPEAMAKKYLRQDVTHEEDGQTAPVGRWCALHGRGHVGRGFGPV